ncbi:sugar transferase [Aeromicrobium sp.]|uniref:sugar transferase n=1 Tax=Aeromicrobium sp. TaxID=1871063 RepID=UPI0019CA3705|nr:sugar transferase [Aeromicrobium sp.]MBC7631291.1 sugar transferase [Aeromicrobium sp.]
MSLGLRTPAARPRRGPQVPINTLSTRESGAEWQRHYGRLLILSDAVVLAWVFLSNHLIWAAVPAWRDANPAGSSYWIMISILLAVTWHAVLTLAGTRDPRVLGAGPDEYKRVINSTIVVFSLVAFLGYLFSLNVPRSYVLVCLPFGLVLLTLSRWSWRQWLLVQRQRGRMTQSAIVVGNLDSVEHLTAVIGRNLSYGYRLVGACITGPDAPTHVAGVPVLGGVNCLTAIAVESRADAVIVTSSDVTHPDMVRRLGWELEGSDVEIIVAPALANIAGPRVHIRPVAGLPLLHVEQPSYRGASRWAKGLLDRAGGTALLVAFLPLFVVIAATVKLASPGRVFFVQERVGLDGHVFGMIKFRTMVDGADSMLQELQPDSGNEVMFKMRDDPRVTRSGRFFRRFSLDELPQLINVVKGDMSLVGPRPPLVAEVSGYAPEAHRRLLVRPGMTGPWQISGRSDLDWEETMRLDLYYVENWSIVGDLLILWKTFRAVRSSAGAY